MSDRIVESGLRCTQCYPRNNNFDLCLSCYNEIVRRQKNKTQNTQRTTVNKSMTDTGGPLVIGDLVVTKSWSRKGAAAVLEVEDIDAEAGRVHFKSAGIGRSAVPAHLSNFGKTYHRCKRVRNLETNEVFWVTHESTNRSGDLLYALRGRPGLINFSTGCRAKPQRWSAYVPSQPCADVSNVPNDLVEVVVEDPLAGLNDLQRNLEIDKRRERDHAVQRRLKLAQLHAESKSLR